MDDIKKLEYYTEDIKFGGTKCHGVVVYEIDQTTKLQTDAFTYVECGDVYPVEKTEKHRKLREVFSNCFPVSEDEGINTEQNHENNKKYALSIKFVENDLNGKQIMSTIEPKQEEIKRNDEIIYSFKAPRYERGGNIYVPFARVTDSEIVIEKNDDVNSDGSYTFNVKKLPNKDSVITIVYSVEKYFISTNYLKFDPSFEPKHNNVSMTKASNTEIKFRGEEVDIETPSELYEEINGKNEKFVLRHVYEDNELVENFNKKVVMS